MNVIHALLGEHGALKHEIDTMRREAKHLAGRELSAALRGLAGAVESHARLEDELLFVPLEATGRMPAGPIATMRAEHDSIESLFGRLLDPSLVGRSPDEDRRMATRLAESLLEHFAHEENVLFVLAARMLDVPALERLGDVWAQRRAVRVGAPAGAAFA
jgi:hemerythrin-like domain-containing protein